MSAHVFHEIYLHLNWHVKDDQPTLGEPIEAAVHRFLSDRCRKMKGVYLHGIGGTDTHVHLAVNIEPFVTISDMVKDLKGGSSHDANTHFGEKLLYWQRGYGVVSFGKKNLPWVLDYIARQKEHHARGTVYDRLERVWVNEEEGIPAANLSKDAD
jgi:putative transposase